MSASTYMVKNIRYKFIIDASPDEVFEVWMDSEKHSEMIDGNAKINPKVGGLFEIWDGAIMGKTIECDPKKFRIVQEWRYDYDDWPKNKPSKIIIELAPYKSDKCLLKFMQSKIPDKYSREIAQGWEEYYWKPMKEYFISA